MKNQKGFSFVEMILVIAIVAILTGVAGISIGLIARSNVNRTVQKLDSAFSQARTQSMAKGNLRGMLFLTYENNRVYCYVGSATNPKRNEEKVEIAVAPVQVSVFAGGTETVLSPSDNEIIIGFIQTSGAIDTSIGSYEKIKISNDRHTMYLHIYPITGKHKITEVE